MKTGLETQLCFRDKKDKSAFKHTIMLGKSWNCTWKIMFGKKYNDFVAVISIAPFDLPWESFITLNVGNVTEDCCMVQNFLNLHFGVHPFGLYYNVTAFPLLSLLPVYVTTGSPCNMQVTSCHLYPCGRLWPSPSTLIMALSMLWTVHSFTVMPSSAQARISVSVSTTCCRSVCLSVISCVDMSSVYPCLQPAAGLYACLSLAMWTCLQCICVYNLLQVCMPVCYSLCEHVFSVSMSTTCCRSVCLSVISYMDMPSVYPCLQTAAGLYACLSLAMWTCLQCICVYNLLQVCMPVCR